MPHAGGTTKTKPIFKTILFGAVTAVLYGVTFLNTGAIMPLFAKGGMYALFPIATVFVFTFSHATFASNLWSVLGVEADLKKPAKQVEKTVKPTKRTRPRLRLSA